jgi:hypothetical protein
LYEVKNGKYIFSFNNVPKGRNVIFFGEGGIVVILLRRQVLALDYCNILFIADNNYENIISPFGCKVISPKAISDFDFDFVVISVRTELQQTLKCELRDLSVAEEKIDAIYRIKKSWILERLN